MKIGIDIRSTLRQATGIGKYTLNLINALAKVDRENRYYLYSRKKILDFKRRLPRLPGANFSHCVDYFKRGPDAVLPDIDTFYTPSYDLERPKKGRFIVTIHGVTKAHPFGHSKRTVEEIDKRVRRVISEADVIVTDSYNTKSELLEFYEVPESKVFVIYPVVETLFKKAKARPRLFYQGTTPDKEGYILFVGTLEPRKNVDGLIKAFGWLKKEFSINHKLYIVGMRGWMFEKIFKAHEDSEFKKDIIFKGYVSDEELGELYQNAAVFAYPSFHEGFGFPIVEAFCAGTPVVTSKTSSCGEIARDSALLADPTNYKEIGEAILRIINDGDLREELVRKGIERSKKFTGTESAEQFIELFTQA